MQGFNNNSIIAYVGANNIKVAQNKYDASQNSTIYHIMFEVLTLIQRFSN
jgi:hypothetical protein